MRKCLSILLLTVLLTYMGGYHLWYVLYKVHLKTEMKLFIASHPDTKAACHFQWSIDANGNITDPSFSWEEKNHEFKLNGLLYDVVHIQYNQTTVTICCLPDNAENSVDLQHFVVQKNKQDAGKQNRLSFSQIFSFFYQPELFQILFPEPVNICWHTFHSYYLHYIALSVVLPPPRFTIC
ncbi:MAG: hypothetical protein EKK39_06790 [Sphingobacteriales bacterium]|uniref:hypothetical protein n=1 Tax=Hydrotalea flava TaxID=714549 RepID=UPI000FA5E786|nr:hypothetical protein [Hydrotalea flava]RTL52357.1 MAG: hypothetical protein EKK39_06790 [Sphingobacteriales bacterium]